MLVYYQLLIHVVNNVCLLFLCSAPQKLVLSCSSCHICNVILHVLCALASLTCDFDHQHFTQNGATEDAKTLVFVNEIIHTLLRDYAFLAHPISFAAMGMVCMTRGTRQT